MAPKDRYVDQNFFNDPLPPIYVRHLSHSQISEQVLTDFLDPSPTSIGISWGTKRESASLTILAIATATQVLLIALGGKARVRGGQDSVGSIGLARLKQRILCRGEEHRLFAFDLGPLACALYDQYNLHVQNAIDIQDCCHIKDRSPLKSLKLAAGDTPVYAENIISAFESMAFDFEDPICVNATVLRAWAAQRIGSLEVIQEFVAEAAPVDTSKLTPEVCIICIIDLMLYSYPHSTCKLLSS
jgi:hypothetical protein